MYAGKLIKVSENKNALRTIETLGKYSIEPTVGSSFDFYAKPLDPAAVLRLITTSYVMEVEHESNAYIFTTENSKYRLELNCE